MALIAIGMGWLVVTFFTAQILTVKPWKDPMATSGIFAETR
jgi:hypothetical protein